MLNIERYLDHAVLKPEMTREEAAAAIQLGIDHNVKSVCVRPCDIAMAKEMCRGTQTEVGCVLDFPYGYGGEEAKRLMAREYVRQGVDEIDMVMNYGYARGGEWDTVEREIRAVVEEAHAHNIPVKVIFETSQLDDATIRKGTQVCIAAGADFVKTSTGFNGCGATPEAVTAMLEASEGKIMVKPSGGIRDIETAQAYLEMGVHRLGVGYSSTPKLCKK